VSRLRTRTIAIAAAALLVGAGVAGSLPALGEGGKQDVSNMDLDLLRENLLKIWIVEYSSQQHNMRRIGEKSFEGLNPVPATGDPETDRKNAEGRRLTDKHLRHYMLLELDGAIESVDICDRVLGSKVSVDAGVAEQRKFLASELPEINWSNVLLQDAVADLAAKLGVEAQLHPVIPKNLTLEISFQGPKGYALLNVLEYINSIHPITWKYEAGKLDVTYIGEIPKNPYGR
jgi:hypothetical protein